MRDRNVTVHAGKEKCIRKQNSPKNVLYVIKYTWHFGANAQGCNRKIHYFKQGTGYLIGGILTHQLRYTPVKAYERDGRVNSISD
jgi:hypothetical protein